MWSGSDEPEISFYLMVGGAVAALGVIGGPILLLVMFGWWGLLMLLGILLFAIGFATSSKKSLPRESQEYSVKVDEHHKPNQIIFYSRQQKERYDSSTT